VFIPYKPLQALPIFVVKARVVFEKLRIDVLHYFWVRGVFLKSDQILLK
jgi:hypothetical protein